MRFADTAAYSGTCNLYTYACMIYLIYQWRISAMNNFRGFLADRTALLLHIMISYWHHHVVRLSVCLSVVLRVSVQG